MLKNDYVLHYVLFWAFVNPFLKKNSAKSNRTQIERKYKTNSVNT